MTEQEIEAIAARAAAATPGPWLMEYADGADSIDLFGSEPIVFVTTPDDDAEFCIGKVHYVTHQTQHDGQFIADARTNVPALIAALREANATIERVRELAFATPGRHADAPCTARCVIDLCLQIHAALVGSERGLASEAP